MLGKARQKLSSSKIAPNRNTPNKIAKGVAAYLSATLADPYKAMAASQKPNAAQKQANKTQIRVSNDSFSLFKVIAKQRKHLSPERPLFVQDYSPRSSFLRSLNSSTPQANYVDDLSHPSDFRNWGTNFPQRVH